MFEHHHQPLLPRPAFVLRLIRHGLMSVVIVIAALAIGVIGYHVCLGLGWTDSVLNAAMILGGMGPVADLGQPSVSTSGKLFAAAYALFSGLVFIVVVGVLLAPALHRVLHRFHLDAKE
jgi:hypothetical protein